MRNMVNMPSINVMALSSAEVAMEPWFGRFSGKIFTKASSLRRNAVGKFHSPDTKSCR